MLIKDIPLKEITPYKDNPRKLEPAIDKVAKSIEKFGFRQPLVLDTGMVIIVGHVRYHAAKMLGLKKVPVHIADDLTPEAVQAYRLADNRLSEEAEWDSQKLSKEIQTLDEQGFDLTLLGFTADELAQMISGIEEEFDDSILDFDEAPPLPKKPTTQPGDLYEIGSHRLLCGDATNLDDYKKLLGEDRINLVFTDPPYNVNYSGGTDDKLSIMNDHMKPDDFKRFLMAFFLSARLYSVAGASIYICHADSEGAAFREAMIKTKWQFKQCLIWVKNTFVLSRQDYHYQHEPILYGWKGGSAHTWHGGRNQSTIWNFDKPARNGVHPTMKPIELVKKAIENSSDENAIVMDAFGGSGTTMIVAQITGRVSRLLELDPKYCDVIVERMRSLWPGLPIKLNGKKLE